MDPHPLHRQDLAPTGGQLLIAGASTRAAAQSAVRAGLQPVCADLFADDDLREIADVLPLQTFPRDLLPAARQVPGVPWMYTGALENQPGLVGEISDGRELWGNPPEVLAIVRDPRKIQDVLAAAGIAHPAVCSDTSPPPADGRWLVKPLNGSGGRAIHLWNKPAAAATTLDEPHYFQQRVHGIPFSALFVASRERTHLVGITRQLVGRRMLNAPEYGYCGSWGPLCLESNLTVQIRHLGQVLAEQCGLRGLWGCDLIWDEKRVQPIEINPRYTASVEVFERAGDIPLLDWHRRACRSFSEPVRSPTGDGVPAEDNWVEPSGPQGRLSRPRVVAKAILFASTSFTTPDFDRCEPCRALCESGSLADRPAPGTHIEAGQPVCTVLASCDDEKTCLRQLMRRVRSVRRFLGFS
jgi:predicted ATP-grasp superfamily ATP-dependent carboligase